MEINEIEHLIDERFYYKKDLKFVKVKETRLNLIKYEPNKNDFCLILNRIKPNLRVIYTKYYKVLIDDKIYLAYKVGNEAPLAELSKKSVSNNIVGIRNIIAFNWIMCVNQNNVSDIKNHIFAFTFEENKFADIPNYHDLLFKYVEESLDVRKMYRSKYLLRGSKDIPRTILKEYFENSPELFHQYVEIMMEKIDPEKLRYELLKIVREINQEYIPWVNLVYERVSNARAFFKSENGKLISELCFYDHINENDTSDSD